MKPAVLGSFTFAVLVAATLSGCSGSANEAFPGYAEGEYIRLAAPFSGNLDTLSVKRGDRVAANAPLFALEQENERAAREICGNAYRHAHPFFARERQPRERKSLTQKAMASVF